MYIILKNIISLTQEQIHKVQSILPARYEEALKYRFENDRKLSLCASYLILEHTSVKNQTDIFLSQYGKPEAVNPPHFNISHSGDYSAIAVADTPVGLDIEKITSYKDNVARHVFTQAEYEYIELNTDKFFMFWTMKESVMKAIGKGFSLSPSSFDVLPSLNHQPITVDNTQLYIRTAKYSEYMISVCTYYPVDDITITISE